MKRTIIIIFTTLFMLSCDVIQQLGGAYNLSQCEYAYNSIDNVEIAGINLNNLRSVSVFEIASLSTILSGKSLQEIPFSMTVNLDVKNPNEKKTAFLNGLEYIIELNDMEFTTGKIETPVRIDANSSTTIPLSAELDIKKLINRYTKDKVATDMSRFLGITPGQTKITLKLQPKLLIGKVPIDAPNYIPITFYVGEKK